MTIEDFDKYESAAPTRYPNKQKIPIVNFSWNDEGVQQFNEIYRYCLDNIKNEFVETPSGGISTSLENWRGTRWWLRFTTSIAEIILKPENGRYYRFIIGHNRDVPDRLTGMRAYKIYTRELLKDGVDIRDHYIENGAEVKATIPAPRIELCCMPERTYRDAHHIDINSAYNAGMIESFPFLKTTVCRLYAARKDKPIYKDVLNMTQGVMQSKLCWYKLSHISKAGYVYTRRKLDEYTEKLKAAGCRILAYNTDGIWYQNETPYHDDDEGREIGQWKNDHVNCTIRFKSKGCYEYIESGNYTPVYRGVSSYERIKPRTMWEWGDIFKGQIVRYSWLDGYGYVKIETDFEEL